MKPIKIPIPPIELQKKFYALNEKVELQKKYNSDNTIILEKLFTSIQQKAFTGRL